MTLLPQNTHLGDLALLDVFEYYDAPRLFTVRNRSDQAFLVVWLGDEPDASDKWLYAPASRERLEAVRRGAVSLRDAFSRTEDGIAFIVEIADDGRSRVQTVRAHDLTDEQLPADGVRLLHDQADEEPLNPVVESVGRNREVVDLSLYPPRARIHEAPAALVGSVLASLQEVVHAVAHAFVPNASERAPTPRWLVDQTELAIVTTFPSSFGVRLASTSPLGLFGDAPVTTAIEHFMYLLRAGKDRAALRKMLLQLRPKTARRYGALLAQLAETESDLVTRWRSSKIAGLEEVRITYATAASALQIIKEIDQQTPSEFRVHGILVAANLSRHTFELRTQADERYTGRISREAMADAMHATLSERYAAVLREKIETVRSTGQTRSKFELVALRRLGSAPAE